MLREALWTEIEWFEWNLPVPTRTDLMAVLGIGDSLAVLAVEAKVDESFGPTVAQWLVGASEAKHRRLAHLAGMFGLEPAACSSLRYQFLHRAASAALEAKRYRARHAAMIVQSFCPRRSGFSDYAAFLAALDLPSAGPGFMSSPYQVGDISLRFGWVIEHGNPNSALARKPPDAEGREDL